AACFSFRSPASGLINTIKSVEDEPLFVRRNARTGIFYTKDIMSIRVFSDKGNCPAFLIVLNGIVQKIYEQTPKKSLVGIHRHLAVGGDIDTDVFGTSQDADRPNGVSDDLVEIDWPEFSSKLPCVSPCESKEIFYDPGQSLAFVVNDIQRRP